MAYTYKQLREDKELYKKQPGEIKLICEQCGKEFSRHKKDIVSALKKCKRTFCSTQCFNIAQQERLEIQCLQCGKKFMRTKTQTKKSWSGNQFCGQSCSGKYNNTHKTKGTRRSKLEIWLETQLTTIYPNIMFLFNKIEVINAELDIFIPSLNLAFELNGIFHYEPIYGPETLNKIQTNDKRKFQACIEKNIELCIIDNSSMKYFKPASAQKYLDIIVNIINSKVEKN